MQHRNRPPAQFTLQQSTIELLEAYKEDTGIPKSVTVDRAIVKHIMEQYNKKAIS